MKIKEAWRKVKPERKAMIGGMIMGYLLLPANIFVMGLIFLRPLDLVGLFSMVLHSSANPVVLCISPFMALLGAFLASIFYSARGSWKLEVGLCFVIISLPISFVLMLQ